MDLVALHSTVEQSFAAVKMVLFTLMPLLRLNARIQIQNKTNILQIFKSEILFSVKKDERICLRLHKSYYTSMKTS